MPRLVHKVKNVPPSVPTNGTNHRFETVCTEPPGKESYRWFVPPFPFSTLRAGFFQLSGPGALLFKYANGMNEVNERSIQSGACGPLPLLLLWICAFRYGINSLGSRY